MCLRTKTNVAKIAKTDLYVIKQFTYYPSSKKIKSPYKEFYWKKNIYYNAEINLITYGGFKYVIKEGLHALYSIDCVYLAKIPHDITKFNPLYICKIPKGSKYYLGDSGDIVSNKMKIVEIGYEVSKYSPTKYVSDEYAFKKVSKKLKEKYGKQNY